MDIAIVGGGINGLCAAWLLARQDHRVTLYEQGRVMQATSSASSKLLHGGLRYLENGEFRLVREALRERSFWIENAPDLAKPIKLYLPIYRSSRRPAWKIKIGLTLYDMLAGKKCLGRHGKEKLSGFKQAHPELKTTGLKSVYSYYDAQMQDEKLGLWVAHQAKKEGVQILEHHLVTGLTTTGLLTYNEAGEPGTLREKQYDRIINIAGPWAEDLLKKNSIDVRHSLDLVRGSHIVFKQPIKDGYILEVPDERRIFFVLPYKGKTMVGTTEIRQTLDEPISPTEDEQNYLINAYNHYFREQRRVSDIQSSFAGLRPLIKSAGESDKLTREYVIERTERLITVFGGKWTTARALAEKLVREVQAQQQSNSCSPATRVPWLLGRGR